eukprot:COSAG02_NODE_35715_length_464_cov_1.172603_2_plen_64_part_00
MRQAGQAKEGGGSVCRLLGALPRCWDCRKGDEEDAGLELKEERSGRRTSESPQRQQQQGEVEE